MVDNRQHVKWFRESSPYIKAHRNKTFVIHLGGEAMGHENFHNIIDDILLLNSLGIRLVLAMGAKPQIDSAVTEAGQKSQTDNGVRITSPELLPVVQQTVGKLKIDLEAALSRGIVKTTQSGRDIFLASGNYIKAKPFGIRKGIDFHHTGTVRKINTDLIHQQLDMGAIVIVAPIGYSPSGEIFNIHSTEVAGEVATALLADKLILLVDGTGQMDHNGELISELAVSDIQASELKAYSPIAIAHKACLHSVERCHLISYKKDGALLEELFTRDGVGTQITRVSYEQIRNAASEDIPGILELIEPLETEGTLVKRSRELIESEIDKFIVIERDGLIVSCAALYPFEDKGELACLATHPSYRNGNRGELLLKEIKKRARTSKMSAIFVLTTVTTHWFTERGFVEKDVQDLPHGRHSLYNYQRKSKYFEMPLKADSQ